MGNYRPMGVDYSRSPVARLGFIRFGILFGIVGAVMALVALFGDP